MTLSVKRQHVIDLPYPPPFMTADVLAKHLCISVATVELWTADGLLPAPIKPRGIRLWQWSKVIKRLAGDGDDAVQSAPVDPYVAGAEREAQERKRDGRIA